MNRLTATLLVALAMLCQAGERPGTLRASEAEGAGEEE